MAKPLLPFWGVTGTKTEPPGAKKNAGFKAGRPESAQYFNWFGDLVWKWLRGVQGDYADIVVGSAGEVTSNDADNTADDFVAAIANGDTVRFLAGTHALSRNEDVTETDVTLLFESDAILDDGTDRTFTVSGVRSRIGPGRFSGFTAGDIIISGAGSRLIGIDLDSTVVDVSNGAEFYTTGANGGQSIAGSAVTAPLPFGNLEVHHEFVQDFTTDFAVDDKLDITAHGYENGLPMQLTTSDTLPMGLALATTYYVINKTANDFELSLTPGGSAVDINTDDGTGTHTANPGFVVPVGIKKIFAELYGGGGGGASGNDISASTCEPGGSGAAGGSVEGFLVVVPGTFMPFVIGPGGVGATSESSDGTAGTASSFDAFTANGGGPGTGTTGQGGVGGTASGGDINLKGGDGTGPSSETLTVQHVGGPPGGANKRGVSGGGAGISADDASAGGDFGGGGGGGGAESLGASAFGDGGDGGRGGLIIWS